MLFAMTIPALIKIALVFAFILVSGKSRLPFGIALFIASIVTGLWFGMKAIPCLVAAGQSIISLTSIQLIGMILLIMFFSGLLEKTGQLKQIVESMDLLASNMKVKLAVMTALIGFLPVPGGALFSAPMVDSAAADYCIAPERKTNINYFFRHIWEFWWPLYPGVIFFLSMSGLSVTRVFAINFPLTLFMIGVGYLFFLRDLPFKKEENKTEKNLKEFFKKIMPFLIVLIVIFLYKIFVTLVQMIFNISLPADSYTPVYFGLIVGILLVFSKHPFSIRRLLPLLLNKKNLDLCLMLAGVMAFKAIMEQSGAVMGMKHDLEVYHLPVRFIILILPFLSGFVFGIMFAMVGASFPLILPLIQTTVPPAHAAVYFLSAFAAGFCGMMSSPLHSCLLLTKRHFGTTFPKIYRELIAAILSFALLVGGYYLLLFKLGLLR